MYRRAIGALALLALTVACGSPVQRAANRLMEQVSLGDPLAQQTYAENKEILESAEAVPIWVDALHNSESPQVKEWAAQMLGNIGDESTLPALVIAVSDSRDVRDAAVAAIKQFSEEQAGAAFIEVLESGNRDGQAIALAQISRLRPVGAVPAVAAVAISGDELLSRTAMDTLGDIGDMDAADALAGILADASLGHDPRHQAMLNLARIEGADAQMEAVLATLEEVGDEASLELIEQARSLQ